MCLTFVNRVIGAIVIVAGLYLVVWGKSKDYKSESLPIDDKKAANPEHIIEASNNNDEKNQKVLTINEPTEENAGGEGSMKTGNQTR